MFTLAFVLALCIACAAPFVCALALWALPSGKSPYLAHRSERNLAVAAWGTKYGKRAVILAQARAARAQGRTLTVAQVVEIMRSEGVR